MKETKYYTIPPHKHCVVCGKPMSEGKDFCSPNCRQAHEKRERKYKRMNLLLYLPFIILMAVIALYYLSQKS